jgi:uncharacterized membrane protein (UPF0136 family)
MLQKSTSWSVLVYGLIIVSLGIWGYIDAGSKISFFVGGGLGLLLVLSSLLMFAKSRLGGYAAVLFTLLLTATFGIRYSITHKEMPALLAVVSGGMLLFLLGKTAKWKK